jgi:ubiquinone/menaquinone biosynthesis C-methylase UbiE
VLAHIPDIQGALREMARVVRPGARNLGGFLVACCQRR